jgi:hypothetical protein
MRRFMIAGVTCFIVCGAAWIVTAGDLVPYPEGYRNWFHVKTMAIFPGHPLENPFGGIHHVYANKEGAMDLKSGTYEDGAVLVFDLLEYVEGDDALQEGKRKLIGVMMKTRRYTLPQAVGDLKDLQGTAEATV